MTVEIPTKFCSTTKTGSTHCELYTEVGQSLLPTIAVASFAAGEIDLIHWGDN